MVSTPEVEIHQMAISSRMALGKVRNYKSDMGITKTHFHKIIPGIFFVHLLHSNNLWTTAHQHQCHSERREKHT
jgi:hypothetical protein